MAIKGIEWDLEKILFDNFSYKSFRRNQKEIIQSVLDKNDTLAILPTGTGKSLCYQLPGYILEGTVIIVSPLLSLMQDQVEQMKARGEKRVVALNSFLSFEERNYCLRNMNTYKFIYISPEMLQSEQIQRKLKAGFISLLVIDEAHCISQWGYDFRPDYLELGKIRSLLGNPPILALTATARDEVKKDIIEILQMDNVQQFDQSVDRPNISFKVDRFEHYQQKTERLLEYVQYLQKPGIIYFTSKKLADEWAAYLNDKQIAKAASYHAGIEQEERILLQQQFLYDEIEIMCATSAFGMGVNKNNIRFVIHFHSSQNIESYLQEVGRAGRDGKKSIAILLFSNDDFSLQQQLIESEFPNPIQIKEFTNIMIEMSKKWKMAPIDHDNNYMPDPYEGFSETQWRLLWKFYKNLKNKQEFEVTVLKFIESRLTWKHTRLLEMNQWIGSTGCKRENILRYFGENKKISVEECCDHCGLDLNLFRQLEGSQHKRNYQDWQYRLNEIFSVRGQMSGK